LLSLLSLLYSESNDLVILAGDEIEITVDQEGRVGYDQTEFQNDE